MVKVNKFVVRGSFGATEEIWSNTLHFTSETQAGPDTLPSSWDEGAVTSAVNTFYGTSATGTVVHVDGWRGYQCDAVGKLVGNNMKRVDYTTKSSGGGSLKMPYQVSAVVSLLGADRGLGSHGRIYLPGPVIEFDEGTGRWTVAGVNARLAEFKTYVEALKDAMFSSLVAGEEMLNVGGQPASQVIQKVATYRFGRVPDTLRTRRNKLAEAYEALSA